MLFISITIFLALIIFFHPNPKIFFNIPYKTILALSIFMLLSNALYYSNYPKKFLLYIFKNSQKFNVLKFLIVYCILIFLFSYFLTNDIALFLTLPILKYMNFDLEILNILGFFLIWSANIGACASPIGSPQNIFVWSYTNISFFKFSLYLIPLFIAMLIAFLFFLLFYVKKFLFFHTLNVNVNKKLYLNKKLLILSCFFFLLSIIFFNSQIFYFLSILIFLVFLILYPYLIKNLDYSFILFFIFLSLDINILKSINILNKFILNFNSPYFSTAFLSQIISNFPACLLMTNVTKKTLDVLYGANVACNGVIYASIANLIGIKILRLNKFEFLKISVFAFLLSLPFGYMALKVIHILFK